MATSFDEVYGQAAFRFTDMSMLSLNVADQEAVLHQHLKSAIAEFAPVCEYDLNNFSADGSGWDEDLDAECIAILALGVSFYWLSSKVLNMKLLKNSMSTKDYTFFSPANLLREASALRDSLRKEFRDSIVKYTYRHGDIAGINEV